MEDKEERQILETEAARQVRQMGRMMAALYYHIGKEMISELGEERAQEILARAVWSYGEERGEQQREKVLAAGFDDYPLNYGKVKDLPTLGWDVEPVVEGENSSHIKITYCPFAEYWKEQGFEKTGRIYCSVDQAKYNGFNPASCYVHLKNQLDGDSYCEMLCRI